MYDVTYGYGLFAGGSDSRESAYSAGDLGSIPGLGRSPGEGNGYPLQYSCLDRGAWWATVYDRVSKSQTQLGSYHCYFTLHRLFLAALYQDEKFHFCYFVGSFNHQWVMNTVKYFSFIFEVIFKILHLFDNTYITLQSWDKFHLVRLYHPFYGAEFRLSIFCQGVFHL